MTTSPDSLSIIDTLWHSMRWPMEPHGGGPIWITDAWEWIATYGPLILVGVVGILLIKAIAD